MHDIIANLLIKPRVLFNLYQVYSNEHIYFKMFRTPHSFCSSYHIQDAFFLYYNHYTHSYFKFCYTSKACRFHRSHQWSNLPGFRLFALQIAESYYSSIDKCFGYNLCSWQHIQDQSSDANYSGAQRDTFHFCSIKV